MNERKKERKKGEKRGGKERSFVKWLRERKKKVFKRKKVLESRT